jgi:hypothetical protein
MRVPAARFDPAPIRLLSDEVGGGYLQFHEDSVGQTFDLRPRT